MPRKRSSDEDALKILHEIDVHLHDWLDGVSSCRNGDDVRQLSKSCIDIYWLEAIKTLKWPLELFLIKGQVIKWLKVVLYSGFINLLMKAEASMV